MDKLKKEKLEYAMMDVLSPIGMMTFNEWWTKTFMKYPELDTAEYGNYFRNAQQSLVRKENVELIGGQWTLLGKQPPPQNWLGGSKQEQRRI